MEWSSQQQAALTAVKEWLEGRALGTDSRQCFYLAGYAGSGKTTLAREFALEAGLMTIYVAFTGKAALVLRQKGCPEAQTIHSVIYVPVVKSKRHLHDLQEELADRRAQDPDCNTLDLEEAIQEEQRRLSSPSFELRQESVIQDVDLVVCDEVSMVDEQMGADLASFGTPILVLGDPAQLPPVKASQGYFTKEEPDFMLTEVHRQAAGSPVLQLATEVRQGKRIELGDYGESRVLPSKSVKVEEAITFDQIICGRNKTRHAINRRVRETLGRSGALPEEGDRLVCLRNDKEGGVLNGSFWTVIQSQIEADDPDTLRMMIEDADSPGSPRLVLAHSHHFEGRDLPWFKAREALEFDYGYAITCHKAQGSQWDRVLVYDESACFRRDRHKWLYTALTRASESVTVVRT